MSAAVMSFKFLQRIKLCGVLVCFQNLLDEKKMKFWMFLDVKLILQVTGKTYTLAAHYNRNNTD